MSRLRSVSMEEPVNQTMRYNRLGPNENDAVSRRSISDNPQEYRNEYESDRFS